jgi:hypothetical protein
MLLMTNIEASPPSPFCFRALEMHRPTSTIPKAFFAIEGYHMIINTNVCVNTMATSLKGGRTSNPKGHVEA